MASDGANLAALKNPPRLMAEKPLNINLFRAYATAVLA
jgi:hypothetical protein